MWDDLLVNDVSLRTFGRMAPQLLLNEPPLRGSNAIYPGVDYETFLPKSIGTAVQPVLLTVLPWDRATKVTPSDPLDQRARLNLNARDLADLLRSPDAPLTLARKVSLPAGDITETADAELVGSLQPDLIVMYGGRCALTFSILSAWTAV